MTKKEWWWEFNRERINIVFEDDEGEDVSHIPMFSDATEQFPDDENFTVVIDDMEYIALIDEDNDQIEVSSDEAFIVSVSKDVAYIFGFLAGLRTPITLPRSTRDNLQTLVSACLGDYSKLEALHDVEKQDLLQALGVFMRKVHPLSDDLAPQPKMKVIPGGEELVKEEKKKEDQDSNQDWESLKNQISKAINQGEK